MTEICNDEVSFLLSLAVHGQNSAFYSSKTTDYSKIILQWR